MKTIDSIPMSLQIDGRTWTTGAEPVRWYERINWWETQRRAPRGSTPRIDVEVWQVQARLGRAGDLVTYELLHDRDSGGWEVRSRSTVAA